MQEIQLSEIYGLENEQMGATALLGIEKAIITEDSFSVVMEAGDRHLNAFGSVHGGILYTLCDQASGAYFIYKHQKGIGMDGSIHYYRPAIKGDVLTATAYERKSGKRACVYFVELKNQDGKLLADGLFTAMCLE